MVFQRNFNMFYHKATGTFICRVLSRAVTADPLLHIHAFMTRKSKIQTVWEVTVVSTTKHLPTFQSSVPRLSPKHSTLHQHHCESLKSHISVTMYSFQFASSSRTLRDLEEFLNTLTRGNQNEMTSGFLQPSRTLQIYRILGIPQLRKYWKHLNLKGLNSEVSDLLSSNTLSTDNYRRFGSTTLLQNVGSYLPVDIV